MLTRFHLLLLLLSVVTVAGSAAAGNIVALPSDVSVSLMAEPTLGLESGDAVAFTVSVTNNGPEVVDRLSLASSFFRDELDVFAGSVIACEGPLIVSVADYIGGYEYWISWDPVSPTDPALLTLDVGETRTCHFSMPLTSAAPDVYPFSFGLADFLADLDASNNSASVTLRRAVGLDVAPVPTLSPFALSMLGVLLTGMVWLGSTHSYPPRQTALTKCQTAGLTQPHSLRRRAVDP